MSESYDIRQQLPAAVGAGDLEQAERAAIDRSARVPVLVFYTSAVFWLLIQTVLGLMASFKIHWPNFLADSSWFTYGHVVPAQQDVLVYGWAGMAGIGTATWLLARLCRVELPRPGILLLGALLWNFAVAAGVLGILAGNGRPFELLEFPIGAMELLFLAYTLFGVWGVVIFVNRRSGHVYISVYYLVAALFWLPWLLSVANIMLGAQGVRGVMQAIVGAWYAQNIIGLWLAAIGLGTNYYLIPKVIGRPIHSYYLASFGFWTFAVFSVWTGMQRLNGGPVPAWIVTTSIVAAFMMLIPVTTVTINYLFTMSGSFGMIYKSPTLRFVFFGAVAYTLAHLVFLLGSFRTVSAITQFTWFGVAENQLFICAFFSMVMFGAMYYIIPRLVQREWLSLNFIRIHFWGSAYGFVGTILLLIFAGLAQGEMQSAIRLTDPQNGHADFMLSVNAMLPFLRGRSMLQLLICVGNITFAFHFVLMLLRFERTGAPEAPEPANLTNQETGAHA